MRLDLLRELNEARAARRPIILATATEGGGQRLIRPGDRMEDERLAAEVAARWRSGRSGLVESADGPVFLTVHLPPPKLVVIGAVHISQALAPMARIAGLDVAIVDPRTAFATTERFPDVPLLAEWPQDALPKLGVDRYTALAALTHDPKIDDPALLHAFASDCFYIGALGSRKTHGRRIERLKAQGVGENALARIHAPIGLDIGAESPAEIATAVLAQVIQALRKGDGAA
ncbi:MAG: XdhC family protein [Pseudomonadota bacterium]|nr:XdhC family protein [Pseudomonadota bacterium]